MRQALVNNFLSKEIENYGLLELTPLGEKFIKEPHSFMLAESHHYEQTDDDDDSYNQPSSGADKELLSMLKDLLRKISKKINLPPFVIFQEPSLDDMAINYPITIEEMAQITGVGQGKAQRYGKEFIELIARYVEEKDIIRPQDMVVRSVVNKSSNKVYVIQSIDRKMSLEDIANAKNLSMDELLSEIKAIINSGTKIDIDYYINEVIDEDKQDEIFDYFKDDAKDESIEDAFKELGEDEFNVEEIRLMRIKFISDMGH